MMRYKGLKFHRPRILKYILVLEFFVLVGIGSNSNMVFSVVEESWSGDPVVQTKYGKVRAFVDTSDTWIWKAIPYAKPPVGDLRWKAPRDPDSWEGVREASEFCGFCPQYNHSKMILGTEDCLYLNIWRPRSQMKKLPVYLWIHGGGNSIGTAGVDSYNGGNLARKANMVVVTTNYRLGPFGWFTHPVLRTGKPGDEYDDSGNYGTLDLIKALTWVKQNIQAFGGDPDNVTIAGESAGAVNVLTLLISTPSKGLFHRAISQSGGVRLNSVKAGDEKATTIIEKLLINNGDDSEREATKAHLEKMSNAEIGAYLRSKTAEEILACYEDVGFGGLLGSSFINNFGDGNVIPETGFKTLAEGTYPNKVPTILGTNKEESKLFLFMNPFFNGKEKLYQIIASYRSDLWKVEGVDDIARNMRIHVDQPDVYAYQFLWGAFGDDGKSVIPEPWGLKLGSCHALEIPFFFDIDHFLIDVLSGALFTQNNQLGRNALSDAMIGYVAQFALTGNPNKPGSNLPEWQSWSNDSSGPKCLLFDADYEEAHIQMSMEELTTKGVKEGLNQLEEPLRSEMKEYLEGRR